MEQHGLDASIFSEEFLRVDPAEIVRSIEEKGYFSFSGAVNSDFLKQMQAELAPHAPRINVNNVTPVYFNEQYFFPHALTCSQSYFDYVTAQALRKISETKFPSGFRLKCHRYYETGYGHSMEWHADNVTNAGVVTDVDGLIFILYVNDVMDGEFQLVSNSFRDRREGQWTYNYTNEFIDKTYGSKIRSFALPAGSLIVYDTFGIHRAKPILDSGYTRKSIFFQVDANSRFAEQLLLCPSLFRDTSPETLSYLGFGQKHDFPPNPVSCVRDVPARHLWSMLFDVAMALVYRGQRAAVRVVLSHDQRMRWERKAQAFAQMLGTRYPRTFKVLRAVMGRTA